MSKIALLPILIKTANGSFIIYVKKNITDNTQLNVTVSVSSDSKHISFKWK
jgi:hypothetical protein